MASFGRIRRSIIAITGAALAVVAPTAVVSAAPPPPLTLPVELDLSRYKAVDPVPFRAVDYADNGSSYFVAGKWLCRVGGQYRYVGCQGRPATAPPGTLGAAIAGDQQGPYWAVARRDYRPTYRFTSPSGFRAPALRVGQRVTIAGVTCTAPRTDVVACRTGSRALILTRAWHKFYFPAGDTAHSPNPPTRFLPPRLQYWNQLPLNPPIPR